MIKEESQDILEDRGKTFQGESNFLLETSGQNWNKQKRKDSKVDRSKTESEKGNFKVVGTGLEISGPAINLNSQDKEISNPLDTNFSWANLTGFSRRAEGTSNRALFGLEMKQRSTISQSQWRKRLVTDSEEQYDYLANMKTVKPSRQKLPEKKV